MVQAKRNERVKALIEVRRLREEFSFNAGMLKGSLAKGRKKQRSSQRLNCDPIVNLDFTLRQFLQLLHLISIIGIRATWAYMFAAASLTFLLVTLINSDVLLPLNKLWMRFGMLLGLIVSPIVLGIIFLGYLLQYQRLCGQMDVMNCD